RVRSAGRESVGRILERRPSLSRSGTRELVNLLDHPVGWWRDTAQRLLIERQDRRALPLPEETVRSAVNPLGRLHSLATLGDLGGLNKSVLEHAASDSHPGLREFALRASANSQSDGLTRSKLVSLASDPSVRVRLQAAIVLGGDGPENRQALH